MPRLISRLLRNLEHARNLSPARQSPPQRHNDGTSATRAFTRPDEVDISPNGRSQSILLDRKALRLIYRHARYAREKELAPKVRVSRTNLNRELPHSRTFMGTRRAMTLEERKFWANPYLRMLGSPLRKCFMTELLLPRELLVGMTPMLLPGERNKSAFLPSRVEHPAFRRSRGGRTRYLLCWKSVFEYVRNTGSFRRWKPDTHLEMPMHALIVQQVGHSLRARVLQELQILTRQLRRKLQPRSPPLVRRLTRAEWNGIKSSGVVPYENAVAVLVVPPVNKDPATKERPGPNMTSMPTPEDLEPSLPRSQSYPLSVLYPTSESESESEPDLDPLHLLPSARVPVYNGVPLFPSRTQRAALHLALTQVLSAERTAKVSQIEGTPEDTERAGGDQKASHAFLVCSDENTVLRGDTVPLAIALWRLRMWEASEGDRDTSVHWITNPPRTP
ncbi:hypothetical protein C8Q76DRAFT_855190 [Earliella scabrosa]|nr:hypothetical protein C8Q76DRAFT_855190 [Earliella scabrosa]